MPIKFVPEVAGVLDLLAAFKSDRAAEAIVVDEWGGTAGVVTIADLVEELVGEIIGLGGETVPPPEALEDGSWRVSGAMHIDDWAARFGSEVLPERVRTVGGLFMDLLGRAPRVGDEITLGNLLCTVESCDGDRVQTLLVRIDEDGEGSS